MTLDMKKMRRAYDDNQRGGDIISFDGGKTLLYVHGPCRPDDEHEPTQGLNHIPVVVHYGLGKDGKMAICLDPERNPIIQHPFVLALLKKRKVKLGSGCPVCTGIAKGTLDDSTADEATPQMRFLWGVTPIAHKRSKSAPKWSKMTPKPQVAFVGSTIYNGLMDQFFENGDISDPTAAIFAIVAREGKKRFDTKYEVSVDATTVRKPKKLPTAMRRALMKAMDAEGDCDLFRIVANMVKTQKEVKAMLSGVKVDTDGGDDFDEDEDEDLDLDVEDDDDDLDDDLDDDDDDDDDDDEDDASDDDDDDLDLDDDDDDDVAEDATEDDDDDDLDLDDDDEDDDDDLDLDDEDDDDDEPEPEPEPEPKPKRKKAAAKKAPAKKAPAKKAKAKAKPVEDDDDDDLGLDELDAELERISKAKKAKKAKAKA